MVIIWTLIQISFFLLPVRSAFRCQKSSFFDFKTLPLHFKEASLEVMGAAHSLFAVLSTTYYFTFGNPTRLEIICGGSVTDLEYSIIIISMGYYIQDFFSHAFFGLLTKDTIFHHITTILIPILLVELD